MAGPFVELSSSLSRYLTIFFAPFFGPLPFTPLAPLCALKMHALFGSNNQHVRKDGIHERTVAKVWANRHYLPGLFVPQLKCLPVPGVAGLVTCNSSFSRVAAAVSVTARRTASCASCAYLALSPASSLWPLILTRAWHGGILEGLFEVCGGSGASAHDPGAGLVVRLVWVSFLLGEILGGAVPAGAVPASPFCRLLRLQTPFRPESRPVSPMGLGINTPGVRLQYCHMGDLMDSQFPSCVSGDPSGMPSSCLAAPFSSPLRRA